MGLEALEIGIVEDLDGGFLDGPVHPLGLAIGPGVVWLGKLVLDSALLADTIEDVGAEVSPGWPVVVLPLCQRSCRPDRIKTSGGAGRRTWLGMDRRLRTTRWRDCCRRRVAR